MSHPGFPVDPDSHFDTRAVHVGLEPDPHSGSVIPPIHLTSTFVQPEPGILLNGYEYARAGNPNRDALQAQLASLEGAHHAFVFSSGLAAEDTLVRAALRAGDVLVVGPDAYGGTLRLFRTVHTHLDVRVVDLSDHQAVAAALAHDDNQRAMLWVETPSNPWMRCHDIEALTALSTDAIVVVDNTFASPALQQPLTLGADVVVHSTTKYIAGHSDVLGGAVLCNDDELADRLGFLQRAVGAVGSPMDCWLTSRGLRTLPLRMAKHCSNAQAVAEFLVGHPAVASVHYPGLPNHPDHALAQRTLGGFGGMVSLQLAAGAQAARTMTTRTRIFRLAESLGGVESLLCHPATMTHASLGGTNEEIPADLVRLSVGIEDPADLIADLRHALDCNF